MDYREKNKRTNSFVRQKVGREKIEEKEASPRKALPQILVEESEAEETSATPSVSPTEEDLVDETEEGNPVDVFIKKNQKLALKYLHIVEDMLGDNDSYGYAETTLAGIYDYIMFHKSITEKQIEAIGNIKDKPSGHY